jgi:hypothetical protein
VATDKFDADLKIEVSSFTWDGKLSEVAQIHDDNLRADITRQPGLVAWFGVVQVEAEDIAEKLSNEYDGLKDDMSRARAELDLELRAQEDPKIKLTEKAIEAQLITNPKIKKISLAMAEKRDQIREANKKASILSKIVKALDHKKEMLIVIERIDGREDFAHGRRG